MESSKATTTTEAPTPAAATPQGHIKDWVNILDPSYLDALFALHEVEPETVPTPFKMMNRHWCGSEGGATGMAPGWMVTVGGGTGSGKSLMALNFARAAVLGGAKVGFLSLEMRHQELAHRFYAMLTGTYIQHLERGRNFRRPAVDHVRSQLQNGRDTLARSPMFLVNEDPLPSLPDMIGIMEAWHEWGAQLFVVDYLQLCSAPDENGQSRELAAITNGLRMFAKRTGGRVLGLSQYTLDARRRMGHDRRSPTHDDYIGSSAISNNSHICLCLDDARRTRDTLPTGGGPAGDEPREVGRTWLLNTKSRVGPGGEMPLLWDYRTLTAYQGDEGHLDAWPK